MASTRTLSILVTDLVGSTGMLTSVGHDEYESIRRRHLSDLRNAVRRHRGREVKTMGDGMLAAFDSAFDAARCGIVMQQVVERAVRRGLGVPMRVAIALGEVDVDDDDVHGLPVVEASRLCASASPSEILCSDLAATTLSRRGGIEIRMRGERELKGIPDARPVFEILWSSNVSSLAPGLVEDPGDPPFVGRASELASLRDEARRAAAGETRVVLLTGEAGVGKTRLLAEFARELHADGATILYGATDPLVALPFGPFAVALGEPIRSVPRVEWVEQFGVLAPELARLFGDVSEEPNALEDHSGPERMFGALAAALEMLASNGLVALFVDDVHVAGEDSHRLLRYLAAQRDLGSVLIVAVMATGSVLDQRVVYPLLGRLRREPSVTRVDITGLGEDDIAQLLSETGGRRPGRARPAVVADILDRTAGNALFVCELVRRYIVEGQATANVMPESVRELVAVRLEALPDELRHVLIQAAVIGHEFNLRSLSQSTDRDEDDLAELLDEACTLGIVRELSGALDSYQFRHRLVREVLEASIGTNRRARIHKRAIESLEAQQVAGEPVAIEHLARHYAAAGELVDQRRGLLYSIEAGTRALQARAFRDALEQFDGARTLLDMLDVDASTRAEVLLGYATALTGIGEAQAARHAYIEAASAARKLGDVPRLTAAALSLGAGFNPYNEVIPDPEKAALLEDAATLLGGADPALRARLLSALANVIPSGDDRRRAVADDALALAQASGDAGTIGLVLSERYGMLNRPAEHEERMALARSIVAIGEEAGNHDLVLRGVSWVSVAAAEVADGKTMRAAAEARARLATELASGVYGWNARMYRGFEAALAGDLDMAETHAMAAVSRGIRIVGADAARFCGSQLKMIRRLQGREAEMLPVFEDFADQNPQHLDSQWSVVEVLANEGRRDDALRRLESAPPLDDVPENFEWLHTVSWAALAGIQLDVPELAKDAASRLTPFTELLCTAADACMSHSVAHVLGRTVAWLGDVDQGLELLDRARALYQRVGARPWLVVLAADEAGMKRLRDRLTADDRTNLERARADAHAFGMLRSIETIDGLLQ